MMVRVSSLMLAVSVEVLESQKEHVIATATFWMSAEFAVVKASLTAHVIVMATCSMNVEFVVETTQHA